MNLIFFILIGLGDPIMNCSSDLTDARWQAIRTLLEFSDIYEGRFLHVEMTAAKVVDTRVGGYGIESVITKLPTFEAAPADAGYRGDTVHYAKILHETPIHISLKIPARLSPIS